MGKTTFRSKTFISLRKGKLEERWISSKRESCDSLSIMECRTTQYHQITGIIVVTQDDAFPRKYTLLR